MNRLILNKNKDVTIKIINKIYENDGYCPCVRIRSEDTLCPCKKMRENNICHCGLFVDYEK